MHIRIQQRNGRKTLTTVQGLSDDYDKKKIVRVCKKVRASVFHPEIFSRGGGNQKFSGIVWIRLVRYIAISGSAKGGGGGGGNAPSPPPHKRNPGYS